LDQIYERYRIYTEFNHKFFLRNPETTDILKNSVKGSFEMVFALQLSARKSSNTKTSTPRPECTP